MKVVILCGGKGTRLSEETISRPKPMVEIGGKPILWHIMNHYAHFEMKNFILALGYRSEVIKNYFLNYNPNNIDFEIDLSTGTVKFENDPRTDWRVRMVHTGESSMTGGRLLRLKPYLNETFMLTYGDGVSNINLKELYQFHRSHGKLATVSAVRPLGRFGGLTLQESKVTEFAEKPHFGEGWINGGFFIFEPGVLNYLKDDHTVLERDPLEALAADGELMAYKHNGFWQCMDTIRDREFLEGLWNSNPAWKLWS